MVRLFLFLFLTAAMLFPQSVKITARQQELDSLRHEILKLEKTLSAASTKERKTFELLEQYNKKAFLLSRLISTLRGEEKKQESMIVTTQSKIDTLRAQLSRLQSYYALYITGVYKRINKSPYEYLFSANSVNQAVTRYRFLKSFSERGQREVERITSTRYRLDTLKGKLESDKELKQEIIRQKSKEEATLAKQRDEKKQALSKIKKDKTALQKELESKRIAEQRIRAMITQLIAKAREKKKSEPPPQARTPATTDEVRIRKSPAERKPAEEPIAPLPSTLRGSLRWPVQNGAVIRRFGETRNEKLNTVTLNYGIDIRTGAGAAVRAAGDGEVSAIEWIPGYGTVLIITHANNVRTVYGRVAEVAVREGDRVTGGESIGTVNESIEGNVLHFELWNDRHSQNPEAWLSRR